MDKGMNVLYNAFMKAEIINVGTELLLGHIVNTNAAFLSRKLAEAGIDLYYQSTVGDNPSRLSDALRRGVERSDLIILTGGLGPTVDDITIETVASFLGRRLAVNHAVLRNLKGYFKMRGFALPAGSERQALIPEKTAWIRNRVGTAPGLVIEYLGKTIVCLPGPPRELEPMFGLDVIPMLKRRFKSTWVIVSRTIRTTGQPESRINVMVKDLLELKPPTTVGIYAKLGEVDLKIMAKAKNKKMALRRITKIEAIIGKRLKKHIFGYGRDTLESAVGALLTKRKKRIALAESCTGGLITHRLTNVSGSSKYLTMSAVTYSNEAKIKVLGVPQELIAAHGAVSRQVALAMARGVRSTAGVDMGLAVTGIAGPTGGTKNKPIGLVYIAFVSSRRRIVKEIRFRGTREEIKFQASQSALDLVRRNI